MSTLEIPHDMNSHVSVLKAIAVEKTREMTDRIGDVRVCTHSNVHEATNE